jgi:hypothetical protein
MDDAFAAWGGPVACSSSAECSASMADGSAGRAALCAPFSAAALEACGGNVSLRAGNVTAGQHCVCDTFLSGPACDAVDEAGAYSCSAALLVCVAWYVRILWLSARSAREIAQTGKAGDGAPLNVLRTIAGVVAVQVPQICLKILMFTGAPPDRQKMLLAYSVLNGLTVSLIVALALLICLLIRKTLALAEHRDDERGQRRLRVASGALVSVSIVMTVFLTVLQSPLLSVTVLVVGTGVVVPVIVLMTRLQRLIKASVVISTSSDVNKSLWRAVRRSRTMTSHTLVFFFVQVVLRVATAMTNTRVRAQQLPLAFAINMTTVVLYFVATPYLLEQVVCYIGGPARDARAGSLRVRRTASAVSPPASSQRASSQPKQASHASKNSAIIAPDIDAASDSAAASVRHGDCATLSSNLPVEGSESSATLAPTS